MWLTLVMSLGALAPLDLAEQADLKLVTLARAEGCPASAGAWIISALDMNGEGATCIGNGVDAPRCVGFSGVTPDHLNEVMCAKRAPVAAPSWAPGILAWARTVPEDQRWEAMPILDSPRPAMAITIDDTLVVAIRTKTGWQRSTEPVDRMSRLAAKRIIDTSALTGSPSFGVISSSYDGGSESGTETTTLSVLQPTDTGLAAVASIQIGQFTWLLAAENRRRYPKAATSLDARPHVEVQLVPKATRGVLSLRVGRDVLSKELRGRCVRGDDEVLDPVCVRQAMKARAGRYRLTKDGFRPAD